MAKNIVIKKREESYKLIITEHLEKIIRYLCNRFYNKEYSGTLFYNVEGSFEENNLVITAVDFYLQDIGSSTYTEFSNDVSLLTYMVDNNLLGCNTGLLHSHNNFSAFFSGTDINTLKEEGDNANHFLSLIVNNEGSYCAAITRKVNKKIHKHIVSNEVFTYNTFENKEISSEDINKEYDINDEYTTIEYFNLDIEKPYTNNINLDDRINFILQNKANNIIHSNLNKSINIEKLDIEGNQSTVQEENIFEDTTEISFDKSMLLKHVKQLICCNIWAGINDNIDLDKWSSNLDTIYSKRFPNIDAINNVNYNAFIEAIMEMIVNEVNQYSKYKVYGDDFINLYLEELKDTIQQYLKDSKTGKTILTTLNSYIYE